MKEETIDSFDPSTADWDLLANWRTGSSEAGKLLFQRHSGSLARFFYNKVCSDDPMDLVHETFVRLLRSQPVEHKAHLQAYLFGIAHHVLYNYLQKKWKREREQLDFESVCVQDVDRQSLSSIVTKTRELQAFVQALREIPLNDQIILELKYFEGLSIRQIGEHLQVQESTVIGRIQRGKQRLYSLVQAKLTASHTANSAHMTSDLQTWADEIRTYVGWKTPVEQQ